MTKQYLERKIIEFVNQFDSVSVDKKEDAWKIHSEKVLEEFMKFLEKKV